MPPLRGPHVAILRHCLTLMAIVAMTLRVLIPVGFMVAAPSVAGSLAGGIPIVLCTAQGNVEAVMAADGSIRVVGDRTEQNHDQDDSQSHAPCAFSGSAAISQSPPLSVQQLVPWPPTTTVSYHYEDRAPGRGLAAPPPPATAPPILI